MRPFRVISFCKQLQRNKGSLKLNVKISWIHFHPEFHLSEILLQKKKMDLRGGSRREPPFLPPLHQIVKLLYFFSHTSLPHISLVSPSILQLLHKGLCLSARATLSPLNYGDQGPMYILCHMFCIPTNI